MPIWLYAAAAMLAVSIGFGSGWKVRAWKAGNDEAESTMAAAKELAARNDRAMGAAVAFEAVREKQRVRTITITREVEREVKADPGGCSASLLPAGLRDALTRAVAGDDSSPLPAGPVPATPAASAGDLGGRGLVLHPGPDGASGLRIPPESPR